jgi:hypothetical protein
MNKFILVSYGNEGSTAMLHTLNNFKNLKSFYNNYGMEPFDHYNFDIKPTEDEANKMIDYFFDNNINSKQFYDYYNSFFVGTNKTEYNEPKSNFNFFKYRMDINDGLINIITKYNLKCFIIYRRNIMNFSLSRYFGNCQFKKSYKVKKVVVDVEKFKYQIGLSHFFINKKKNISDVLLKNNIKTIDIYYENFCNNPNVFFYNILKNINYDEINKNYIDEVLKKKIVLKKIHDEDISTYVINHKEIISTYNNDNSCR